jgi:hypothetical protein
MRALIPVLFVLLNLSGCGSDDKKDDAGGVDTSTFTGALTPNSEEAKALLDNSWCHHITIDDDDGNQVKEYFKNSFKTDGTMTLSFGKRFGEWPNATYAVSEEDFSLKWRLRGNILDLTDGAETETWEIKNLVNSFGKTVLQVRDDQTAANGYSEWYPCN